MSKETAEQKLLKLIEAEEGSPAENQAVKEVARSVRGRGFASASTPDFLKSLPEFFKNSPLFRPGQFVGLKQINTFLLAVVLSVCVFLAVTIVSGVRSSDAKIDFQVTATTVGGAPSVSPPLSKGREYLTKITEQRNIFSPAEEKTVEQQAGTVERQRIVDKTKDLRLVGISWPENAETATAMIEDKQTLITYFLKQGEEINGVRIQNIYADRVVLGFQGETLILKL
jgi:hypothetical protein